MLLPLLTALCDNMIGNLKGRSLRGFWENEVERQCSKKEYYQSQGRQEQFFFHTPSDFPVFLSLAWLGAHCGARNLA